MTTNVEVTDRELKLIKRRYWYPTIATPCLIVAFALCGLFLVLEMIHDLAFHQVGFNALGLNLFLAIVAIYTIVFGYCTLACKFGKKQRADWTALANKAYAAQSNKDFTAQTAAAVGLMAAGRLASKADNDGARALGDAAQVAGAAEAVATAAEINGQTKNNAIAIANALGIKLPSTKKVVGAIIIAPIIVLICTYCFMYAQTANTRTEQMAIAQPRVTAIQEALETGCEKVLVDGPKLSSQDEYEITGYLRSYSYKDDGADDACYVRLTLNKFGEVQEVWYDEYVDLSEDKEELLNDVQNDFQKIHAMFANAATETLDPQLLAVPQFNEEFSQKFYQNNTDESFHIRSETSSSKTTFGFYNSTYSDPYVIIEIEYKESQD